jgi:hypothetical protein
LQARIGLGIPVIGELHGGLLVTGGGEEHVGVAAFLVRPAVDFAQAQHLEEGDGVFQRTDADHGVQIFGHGISSGQRAHGTRANTPSMVIEQT